MTKKPHEEYRLVRLLKEFDVNLALSYLDKTKKAICSMRQELSADVESIDDIGNVDPIGFRVSIKESMFVMLSHPICRLRRKIPYSKQIEWEKFFISHLGMVPVYLVNQNNISILKLWGDESSWVNSLTFQKELDKGNMLLELIPSSRPIQYSGMNFLLQYGATAVAAPSDLLEVFQKYYQYGFWSFQHKGFVYSSHFLHRMTKITAFMNASKGLFVVNSVGRSKRIDISGRSIECRELELLSFILDNNENFIVEEVRAFAPLDVVNDLEQRKDIKNDFVNALMIQLQTELGQVDLLSDIIDVGESSFDLLLTMVGMQIHKMYSDSHRPCYVCTLDELKSKVGNMLENISKNLILPITLSDKLDNFELILKQLYPFLIVSGDKVMYTPPLIIEFLSKQGKKIYLDFSSKQELVDLLELMERIHDSKRLMEILLDPRMEIFRGPNKTNSMRELVSINKKIMLYRHLGKVFNASQESIDNNHLG